MNSGVAFPASAAPAGGRRGSRDHGILFNLICIVFAFPTVINYGVHDLVIIKSVIESFVSLRCFVATLRVCLHPENISGVNRRAASTRVIVPK